MPTPEEHLAQYGGNTIMQLMFQLATARAEIDRLREELARRDSAHQPAER